HRDLQQLARRPRDADSAPELAGREVHQRRVPSMIAMRGALALAAAGGLTACTHTSIPDDTSDPCDAAAGTCALLHINGLNVPAIDQLQLEITFGEFHSTTTTGTLGTQVPLPTVTTLMID